MREQHSVGRREVAGEEIQVGTSRRSARADLVAETDLRRGIANAMQVFEFDPDAAGVDFGARKASITGVNLRLAEGAHAHLVEGGELVDLSISAKLDADLDDLIFGFYVKDRLGQRLFGDNSYVVFRDAPIRGAAGELVTVQFRFRMPLLPAGSYMIDAAVASGTQLDHTQQHWIHDALEFRALDETMRFGLVGIPMLDIRVSTEAAQ
jgi:lipopolysaccharide transport system ATP-binding protein